ncbi:SpoIIE family protein phosphatase [Streptomyces sp. NPDC049813]|uniref:SpoIIE family protein phosphatase n=1 Tax=Streptomyces sp. NPDC049813 TaxID=3365597 RepID=UPI00378E221A
MTDLSSHTPPALILVVDDNPTNRYVLGTTLRRAGHDVVEAEDGTSALELLATMPTLPEAALIDVRLPDMTGFEVCERIKASARTETLPVLHISASAVSVTDRTQGLNRGADAYLTEPVAPDELIATVSAVLRYTRARSRAETLAARLHHLHQTTLALYSAPNAQALVHAAVTGASAVLERPATVHLTSPSGTPHAVTHPGSEAPDAALARTAAQGLRGIGVHVTEHKNPGDGRTYLVAAARTKPARPATCVVVPQQAPLQTAAATEDSTSAQDAELLAQVTHTTALALETLRTYSEEHTLALTLQRSFLPERLPVTDRATLAVRYLPASEHAEIGGDFYEALETSAGLLVAVGDVVGHSLDAAMVMGQIRHGLRAYAVEGHPPHVILERLDQLLVTVARGATATLCVMLLEPGSQQVQIANAGHVPPLRLGRAGPAHYLRDHGPLLGLGLAQPPAAVVDVEDDDLLILVTDGLVERRYTDLEESLGRMAQIAAEGSRDPEEMCAHLLERLPPDGSDDVALLTIKVGPARADL